MGRPSLGLVSIVTVGSFIEPNRPVEGNPLAALTSNGVAETLEARERIRQFGRPVDCAFAACPHRLLGVVGEMLILLTGDERTGLAEVPFACHPLGIEEVAPVARVERYEHGRSLGLIFRNTDQTSANFLTDYGIERKEAALDWADFKEARHLVIIGLPLFVQAIAHAFTRTADERRQIDSLIPRNGEVIFIDRIPSGIGSR